jgi:16S rRNA (uracil1498-N3)-methyltransferase
VSASVFLIDPERASDAKVGSEVILDGAEGRHAVAVQRIRVGQTVHLVDGRGRRIIGSVAELTDKNSATITVETIDDEPEPRPRITAVQAIAKADRGELAVQMLTEAGIDSIIPWQAEHSVARWDEHKAVKNRDKWQSTAREAAKQARRAWIPRVDSLTGSAGVADLIANSSVAFVLDEQASTPLTSIDISTVHDVLLVIGPEGGLSDNEREQFADAGADLVRLGPTVLRTSTAGVAALSVVSSRVGRW